MVCLTQRGEIWSIHVLSKAKSANIIEDLKTYCSTSPSRSLAFYYFYFNDTRKQHINNLVYSLLAQLGAQKKNIPPEMKSCTKTTEPDNRH